MFTLVIPLAEIIINVNAITTHPMIPIQVALYPKFSAHIPNSAYPLQNPSAKFKLIKPSICPYSLLPKNEPTI
nr:hypothetical protein [uncultured Romboutsia sp.]